MPRWRVRDVTQRVWKLIYCSVPWDTWNPGVQLEKLCLKCSDHLHVSLDNLKLDCNFWDEQGLIDQRSKWCGKWKSKCKWKVWKQLGHFISTVPTLPQRLGAPQALLFGFLNISYTGAAKSQKCMGREKSSTYRLKDARLLWGLWVQCGHPYLTSGQGNSQQPGPGAQSRGQGGGTQRAASK